MRSLYVNTVQFSIDTHFKCKNSKLFKLPLGSVRPIDRTLSGATHWARVDLGTMAMKELSAFTKARAIVEPHHQIVLCHKQDTRWKGFTPLQRCSRCILQPQPTGQASIRGVMVNIVESGLGKPGSNPETRLFAFTFAQISLGKVWIQFSLQTWVYSIYI